MKNILITVLILLSSISFAQTTSTMVYDARPEGGISGSINGPFGHSFRVNTVEVVTIKNDGKVGIGTSTPSEKLEVNGAIKIGERKSTSDVPADGVIWFENGKFYCQANGQKYEIGVSTTSN